MVLKWIGCRFGLKRTESRAVSVARLLAWTFPASGARARQGENDPSAAVAVSPAGCGWGGGVPGLGIARIRKRAGLPMTCATGGGRACGPVRTCANWGWRAAAGFLRMPATLAALPAAFSFLAGRLRYSRDGAAGRVAARAVPAALACIALVSLAAPAQAEVPLQVGVPTVVATPGSFRDLDVSWTAPDNEGRPEILGYDVRYRRQGGGGTGSGPTMSRLWGRARRLPA